MTGKHKLVLADRFKTTLCEKFQATGECPYGWRCMFAHGEHELRTKEMNMDDGLTRENAVKRFLQARAKAAGIDVHARTPPPLPLPATPAAKSVAVADSDPSTPQQAAVDPPLVCVLPLSPEGAADDAAADSCTVPLSNTRNAGAKGGSFNASGSAYLASATSRQYHHGRQHPLLPPRASQSCDEPLEPCAFSSLSSMPGDVAHPASGPGSGSLSTLPLPAASTTSLGASAATAGHDVVRVTTYDAAKFVSPLAAAMMSRHRVTSSFVATMAPPSTPSPSDSAPLSRLASPETAPLSPAKVVVVEAVMLA